INKFNPHIETMEGAAVLYVCSRMGVPVVQVRGISNSAGPRDRSGWRVREAVGAFTRELSVFL
ncbi:MAG: phosphorylase, partial [Bacteroidales bacterium]